MKKTACFLLLVLAFLMIGCVVAGPRMAPPPPRNEIRTASPGVNHVWIKGHWTWRGGRYVWTRGSWVKARRGYVWVPGRWDRRGPRWVYIKGHWRKRA